MQARNDNGGGHADGARGAGMRLLIAGATGLVGRHLVAQALQRDDVAHICAPTRRPLAIRHDRLENPLVDFQALPRHAAWWTADAAISALGTTMRAAGSQDAFRRVDHDYILAFAEQARAGGTPSFGLVSARGADPASRFFYLRVKGETEADVAAAGFASLVVARPGLILGDRHETRFAEGLATRLIKIASPLLPRAWRGDRAADMAAALLDVTLRAPRGVTHLSPGRMA